MFKKMMTAASRPKTPATKKALRAVFSWQCIFLGAGLIFGALDAIHVMSLPAGILLPFIFVPLGLAAIAYLEVGCSELESPSKNAPTDI